MKRLALRLVAAAVVFAAGWSIGNAQAAEPDFVIAVDAPGGGAVSRLADGRGGARHALDRRRDEKGASVGRV